MSKLLQELLRDREECLVFFGGQILCSCGQRFGDVAEAENHLAVNHEKGRADRVEEPEFLAECLERLSTILKVKSLAPADDKIGRRMVSVPEKVVYVMLREPEVRGGAARNIPCAECSDLGEDFVCRDFVDLETHYEDLHPGSWTAESSCGRLVTNREQLEDSRKRRKRFDHVFLCPIPGCKYHILQARPWMIIV